MIMVVQVHQLAAQVGLPDKSMVPGACFHEGLEESSPFVVTPLPMYRGRCLVDQLGIVDRYWVPGPGELLMPVI